MNILCVACSLADRLLSSERSEMSTGQNTMLVIALEKKKTLTEEYQVRKCRREREYIQLETEDLPYVDFEYPRPLPFLVGMCL